MPRLSNRAWPWMVVDDRGCFMVQRWHRDSETIPFGNDLKSAEKCRDDLNLKDYGIASPSTTILKVAFFPPCTSGIFQDQGGCNGR